MNAGAAVNARAGTTRRGLVAIGDSITRGSGEAMLGLRMQSWALWLAEALTLPFTCLAEDGARVCDALAHQAPRLRGPYDLGCVYVGVNDVRAPHFDAAAFSRGLDELLLVARLHCATLLLVALPETIGVPSAPHAAVAAANDAIAQLAARHQALLLSPVGLRGRERLMPDRVHLTARGEAHLALLALGPLRSAGFAAEDVPLRDALRPLGDGARARYLLRAGGIAQLRDWRRRGAEWLLRKLQERT